MTDSRIILGYIIQAGVRDLSQSLSSDTLQGISSEWSGDTTEVVYIQKSSHWLKQWPITNGLGDKKRRVVIGWRCNLDFVETLEQSTNGKFKKFYLQPMITRLFLSPKPFLIRHCSNQWDLFFLYINQSGSISTSFWRYPLKSVRRKALGWISYFTPSSSSVPPNVFKYSCFQTNVFVKFVDTTCIFFYTHSPLISVSLHWI